MPPKNPSAGKKSETKDEQIKRLLNEKKKLEENVKVLSKDFDFSSLPPEITQGFLKDLFEDENKRLTQKNKELTERLGKAEAALKNKSNETNEGQKSRSGTAKEDAKNKEIERLKNEADDARDKLKELNKTVEDSNEEIQQLRETLKNLEKEKNDQVQKQDKKENERSVDAQNTLRKELTEAKERATKIENEKNLLEKELREANDMIENLKNQKETNAEKPNLPNDNTSTLQTKEKELNDKETKLHKKEEELKTREKETISKEEELRKKENDANSQEENMKSRENEIKQQQTVIEEMENDVKRREKALQKDENELARKREKLEAELSEMENRKQQETKDQHGDPTNIRYTKEFTDLEAQLKSKEKKITQLNIELSDIKLKFNKEPQTNDKNSVGLKADMQKKEQEIARLQNELTEAKGELKKTETDRKKLNNDLGTAISTIEELRTKISKLEKEKTKIDSSNSRSKSANVYRQKLEAANNEIEELKTRLSKVMGANITDNNPGIADLSDLNRPTKLAEKYSELYDNEWTDAYEEIEKSGVKEVDVIKRLFDSLKDVYKFCNQVSVNYTKSIKASALLIPGTDNGRPNTANLPATSRKQITELRKAFAPSLAGDVFKQFLKTTGQSLDKCPQTKKYYKACVDLCWLMSIQDPPVVLDLEGSSGPFDGDKYKTYTKTGKTLDYVVWPPLRLHDGGALLSRGVAQGK